jgi:hypothetical protein
MQIIYCFHENKIHKFRHVPIFNLLYSESILMFPHDTRVNFFYTSLGYDGTSVLKDLIFIPWSFRCAVTVTRSVKPEFHISENTMFLVYRNQSVKI